MTGAQRKYEIDYRIGLGTKRCRVWRPGLHDGLRGFRLPWPPPSGGTHGRPRNPMAGPV